MSLETLELVLKNVFTSEVVTKDFTLVWHAGEPLVVPVDYYRAAARLVDRLRPGTCHVQHSIQTNGILINEDWCEFFLEENFRVGVSIDGPRHIHDAHRKTRNGKGTFEQTLAGIEMLKKFNKDFHVITVLTAENIFAPDELFHFYDHAGISNICFNVEETDGINKSILMQNFDLRKDYRDFLEAFMHLVRINKRDWFVREFDQMRNSIFRPAEAEFENPQTTPFSIISVDVNGKFTTFSPEFIGMADPRLGDFIIGDLTAGPVELAYGNSNFIKLRDEIQKGVDACGESCEYFSVCGGGAPANKLGENGTMDSTETAYCRCVTMGAADIILSDVDLKISGAKSQSLIEKVAQRA